MLFLLVHIGLNIAPKYWQYSADGLHREGLSAAWIAAIYTAEQSHPGTL